MSSLYNSDVIGDLLRTKLYLPRVQTSLVSRPRLLEKLDAGLDGRLTLVSAPAGFGKTTLIAEWANGKRVDHVCWLSLDEVDDDLTRFLTYLNAAIASLGGLWSTSSLDQDVITHYANARPPDVETPLMILINEISAVRERFVLVLDDYQVISLMAIHQALAFLLEHMPPNMHLVICTRVDPPLSLPRLRGRGQISEIRQHDLKFSAEESAQLLQQVAGRRLTVKEAAALAARTEGWAAGLQMAAISLGGSDDVDDFVRNFSGSNRHILDYLLEEVLQGQPQEIQTFLLQTSILDRLSAPLCDALMEQEEGEGTSSGVSSQLILEQLDRSNLFVQPLDNERGWYRTHRLFADLLRLTLRSTYAQKIPHLHRRASGWFEENGFVVEAIDHALAAADFDRAAHLLEEHAGWFLRRGEIALLLRWLDALPDDLIISWPSLCIYHAWARLIAGRGPAEVEARLKSAGEAGEVSAVALVFNSLIAVLLGDVRHSLELSGQALELLPDSGELPATARPPLRQAPLRQAQDGQAPLRQAQGAGGQVPLRQAQGAGGQAALRQAPLRQAQGAGGQAALRQAQGAESAHWRSIAYGNRGMAYVMTGDMEAAIDAFEESARIGREAGSKMAVVGSLSNLAGLTMARGQLHKAAASYRRALDLATDARGRRLPVAHRVLLGLGELAREWNDLTAAERYFTESVELSRRYGEIGPMNLMGLMSLLHLARVKAAQGEIETAEKMFEEARQLALKSETTSLDDLLVETAHARHALEQGDIPAAERWARAVQSPQSTVQTPYEIREVEQLLLARLALAKGASDEALAALELVEQTARQRGQFRRLIEILNLKALALQARGDGVEALDTIGQALALAEPEGYIRIFVDAGEPLARLLAKTLSKGIAASYSSRLLQAFQVGGAEEVSSAPQRLFEPLSERELDVLQLIAEGLTNREIAAQLVISLSTVKGHTANIYGKLGVHRRTLAVARARELGLLKKAP